MAALFVPIVMAGCGSLGYERSQSYRNAQQQLAEAKRDPAVRKHGGAFLRDAEATLDKAWYARFDQAQLEHLAYLAQRKVEIAESITGLQVAAASLQALAKRSPSGNAASAKIADRAVSADIKPARAASKPGNSGSAKKGPQTTPAVAGVDSSMGVALEQAVARRDPRSAVFSISDIETVNDSVRLSSSAERSLAPLIAYLRKNQNSRIIIEGYSSGTGPHEEELSRSLGVAEAARTYLIGQGVERERIFTLGRGADDAADGAGDAASAARNGRIEIGLFQGIGEPAPALTSRASPSPRPRP